MSIVSRIEGLEQELGLAPHSTSTLYRAREIATALRLNVTRQISHTHDTNPGIRPTRLHTHSKRRSAREKARDTPTLLKESYSTEKLPSDPSLQISS
jgi:hypothetical protein